MPPMEIAEIFDLPREYEEVEPDPYERWKQPKTPRKIDFCIYAPSEPDYWGQFDSLTELFEYLKLAVPGFEPNECLDIEFTSEHRALYHVGKGIRKITICVTGI